MPDLPITVSTDLYRAMVADCGQPFADSYLSGSTEAKGILVTRTETARAKILATPQARRVVERMGLRLEGPSYLADLKARSA